MAEKVIALGVTGGIAAYKAADLCSMLVKSGYSVQVLMTENATRFIAPLVFNTLSRRPVITTLWENHDWRPQHVALADEAALFAVVPATANFLAKFAHGIADDALTTFAATFHGKTVVAPAMNPLMWSHAACQENVATLKKRGIIFAGPAEGHVACGANGTGRLTGVEEIYKIITGAL